MPLVLCFINAFYIWTVCCSFMWFDNCQYPLWNILLLVLLMAISPGFSYYRYIMKVSAVPWHVCLVSFHPLLLITGWCCVPPKCFSILFLLVFGTCHSVFICVTSSLAAVIPFFADYMLVPFLILKLYFRHSANKNITNVGYFVFIRYVRLLGNVTDYFPSQRVEWNNVIWIKEEIKQLWQ